MLLLKKMPRVWVTYINNSGEINSAWSQYEVSKIDDEGKIIIAAGKDFQYSDYMKLYVSKQSESLQTFRILGCDYKLPYGRYIAIHDNDTENFLTVDQIEIIADTFLALKNLQELSELLGKLSGPRVGQFLNVNGNQRLRNKWQFQMKNLSSLSAEVVEKLSGPYLK